MCNVGGNYRWAACGRQTRRVMVEKTSDMRTDKDLQKYLFSKYAGHALCRDSSTAPKNNDVPCEDWLPKYLDEKAQKEWAVSSASDLSATSSQRELDEEYQRACEEWEEGVRQLQVAFQVVLIPLIGKWFGRRWSYWCTLTFLYLHDSICSVVLSCRKIKT